MSDLLARIRAALAERYEIEAEQGRGGMATVFRARDLRHGRRVAVKVLHAAVGEAVGAERFAREVQLTARLSHPHILPLLDSGEADGLLYYVMPFVEGESLRDRLRREGPLAVPEALRLTREVADALAYAHGLGVVHRDIKPENILLHGGHAVVADFGIARVVDDVDQGRLTGTGVAIGTPLYMSPEQSSGEATLDGRSDIYSLGCVAYEMLTGEPPFVGPNPMAVTRRRLTESLPPLRTRREAVSPRAAAAIEQALARMPADRFATARAFVDALDAAALEGSSGETPAAVPRSRRPRWAWLAVVALPIAVWGVLRLGGERRDAVADDLTAVAVLPFENLSPDSAQAYVADGLTDEIITSLSMVQGLRVASRTSSMLLAEQRLELPELGRRLAVQTVLEGSVRAAPNRVRVSARLVRVSDGFPIWSETFERSAEDVLRIQEELAGAIVAALTGRLSRDGALAVQSGTSDPEAYDLYLQGRALRLRQTEQALHGAVDFYRAAVARAPGFSRAFAGLGEALAVMGFYEYLPPSEAFPSAQAAATQALQLDPRNASARATLAYVALYYHWDLPRAEAEFRRALSIDPNAAIVHQWYANFLTVAERHDEAEREFQTALQLDPAAPVRRAALIWAQYYRGDYSRAIATYRRVISVDSSYALTFQWGAMALLAAGQPEEALKAAQWAVTLANGAPSFEVTVAEAEAALGRGAEARGRLAAQGAERMPAYDVAKVYLRLGDRPAALRWLERAHARRSHSMVFLAIDPAFEALRDDPAFVALRERVGVTPQ